jgi:amino acid adenylation domain-containing protein
MAEGSYNGVAIVGMACRVPGADSIEEFWANLVAGNETISFFSDADLIESGLNPAELKRKGHYVPARGLVKDADCFDAAFFGVHPKEAEVMDPQQRIFLEMCWAALERAGYAPNQMKGSVGVFAGATFNTYFQHALQQRQDLIELIGSELVMFGNEKDYMTTRVAYKLGLKGPALSISTACSTSLVAVCQGCQSLLTFESDLVLAGGVSVTVPQKRGYYYEEGYIGSPDGHTRTFDAQGAGTVFSNGAGVVVLKRLEDAVKDGDRIYAVIKGAALNNDGSQRVSFGAPGIEGQSEVIAMAQALADVNPETITYVEAHGTATPLGDPIEVAALTKAFRIGTEAKQFCGLGSVKSNVGHLDAAAGVVGLIKVALSLSHKMLPPSLHFAAPNSKLDLANSPFYVNATLQDWKSSLGVPRRAGVSSFGSGGTNAHVVVEEAPELPPSGPSRPWQLLTISAKTSEALDRATAELAAHLRSLGADLSGVDATRKLADAAYTLQTGRSQFVHRRMVACQDAEEGAALLDAADPKRVFTHQQELRDAPVVFMFTGQGAQYAGMGASLYRHEPFFRAEVDRCAALLEPIVQTDLRRVLFPEAGAEKESDALLMQTRFTQPALFVVEYALAKLWMSWGIKPAAMIGHSVGEYVAGCLADVFSLEDALGLVAHRGALVQAQPAGAMLAIRLSEKDLGPLLPQDVSIAAVNAPSLCVASGPFESIARLEQLMESKGVKVRHLHTSHAFHSAMMDPVLEPFTTLLRQTTMRKPHIPYVSNVSARWITDEEAQTPEYWAGHVRQSVRFADGVAELMKDPRYVLLEVGPGQTLSTLARQHPSKRANQVVFASLPFAGDQELRGLIETLGRLSMTGVSVDWQGFYANERRCRTVLPTYPFERKRCWPEPGKATVGVPMAVRGQAACGEFLLPTEAAGNGSNATSEPDRPVSRKERLCAETRGLMQELSGYDLSGADASADLLELGFDSLLLTQAAQLVQRKFNVQVTFRQLMEELSSLDAIAAHLDAILPPDAAPSGPAAPVPMPGAIQPVAGQTPTLEQLWQQQQHLTNQLLQLMGRQPAAFLGPPPTAPSKAEFKSHGPFKPIDRGSGAALSAGQTGFLQTLIARYTSRTGGSKRLAADNRPILADPRSVAGFKPVWKEMVYPIVTTRSEGSHLWDVDGNEYVDFVMGFGASLFGHRPPFVVQAMHEQLDIGFEIGPIQPLAYEVAALMTEFTGMRRVAFTNTGSEAVLAATRIARTVSGRDKIAVFAGAYHGIFDEVLFRPLTTNGELRTAAIAPGIPGSSLAQVIVLDYGNPQSLDILRTKGHEIAAVLVEPVQSRRLDLRPKEFLHELRTITQTTGTALIFDEVVTGFRVHPGGAQAHFGVRADLATYGKVIGGGVSIGVVAGDPKYMDALDGGQWQYGDPSIPEVGMTFFAGTFVRHPLALAAAKAVLTHLKKSGPQLQRRLAERTEQLANDLSGIIDEFHAPYQVTQFSSLIQLGYSPEQKYAGLLFFQLRERGIHIWENRAFVITTAHTEADFVKLADALRGSLAELREDGFLPSSGSPTPAAVRGEAVDRDPMSVSSAIVGPQAGSMDQFPLTDAQKEIWLAAQMGGDAVVAYNESMKLEFRGDFRFDLFMQAVGRVMQRHPILSAKISSDGLAQCLGSISMSEIPLTDLSQHTDGERQRKWAAILEGEVSTPFDLATGPLWRMRAIRFDASYHAIVWTAHHIICDGWSTGLIVGELARVYSALLKGGSPALEQPASFRDYALAAQPESPAVLEAIKYWQRQFHDAPPPLDLPLDRGRPLVRTAKATTLSKRFDPAFYQSLKRIAAHQRTTMVVLLMAAMKTLLYRLTGQSDLVVGLPVAGQAVSGNGCLVGHCVNLVPIRTHVNPAAGFQENLTAVKRSVLDAYDHHQCTIGKILQHVHVPRTAGRQPLVEVIFNVDRDPSSAQFQGLEFTCERNPKRALHYDIFFNFVEGPQGMYVECDYNTDLFDAATMEQWLGHYQTLLASVVAEPGERIDRVPILTEREQDDLIRNWNDQTIAFPRDLRLHELFERQVRSRPHARAVTCEGRHLTYEELNRRANQVSNRLQALGAGPDVLVGLFLDRSLEMLVGILGILKAGAAYVPMDPDYPKERLGYILEDSRAAIVVTQKSLQSELPAFAGRLLSLDADWAEIAKEREDNPASAVLPQDLAYVLFTSGSTGRPKGVALEHRSAVTFIHWAIGVFSADELSGVLFSTSLCFDLSIFELFVTLSAGGTVIVAPNALHLPRLSSCNEVTLINTVPSAITELLHMKGIPSSVKVVNLAGEALSDALVEQIYARTGVTKVYNLYGPTEATTYSTYTLVPRGRAVTIGRPIANTQAYILDAHRHLVPRGVLGELYLAGDGLARGYYGRQDLTKERFLPNPFDRTPGARLYRTGDLCRWLPDKTIQYFGRLDHQVKLRGFRIELGEIEATFDRFPGVRQSLVMAREDRSGQKQLVAYVVAEAGKALGVEDLRLHIKGSLPDFMLPSSIILLEAFPLSPNGKVDRTRLPYPDEHSADESKYEAPRDPLEQTLARIWSKILRVERVGLHDNFFESGGHSLLAVRVIVEIEKLYKRRLPLATLIQAPTVAGLADVLREDQCSPSLSSLVPIRARGSRVPLFLFHSHGGNVLEYYPLVDLLDHDQPVYALQARGLDGRIQNNRSLEDMMRGYIDEIRTLQPEGPYYLGGFCFGGLAALEAARQLTAEGETVALVAMIQTTHPALTGVLNGTSPFSDRWQRVKKRLDLEFENFRNRGLDHIQDRARRALEMLFAKTSITVDRLLRGALQGEHQDVSNRSLAYVLETLSYEHDKAYDRYQPRPYEGTVILFRTAKQLPGLTEDRTLGWSGLLGTNLQVCDVPGHQQNVLVEPHLSVLARELMVCIRSIQERWIAEPASRKAG